MHEPLTVLSAIAAGASCGVAVLVISGHQPAVDAATWLARRSTVLAAPDQSSPTRWSKLLSVEVARDKWASAIDRAGWNESPERVAAFGLVLAICMAVLGL